jgi:hypothetical protein
MILFSVKCCVKSVMLARLFCAYLCQYLGLEKIERFEVKELVIHPVAPSFSKQPLQHTYLNHAG